MTTLRNGPDRWGLVSRLLHWVTALAVLGMLGFGLYLGRSTPRLDTLWLYGLHKSVGLTVLLLVLLRLGWHRLSPPPAPRETGWQRSLARATHLGLLALLVLQPLAGWIGASATGIPTVLYGLVTVPAIAPPSEAWDQAGFLAHRVFGIALAALVALHVAGALWGEFGRRDRTLSRMLGRPSVRQGGRRP